MLNIPVYNKYNGEKKIALLDNSTIAFMHQLEQRGCHPEYLLKGYDVIFLPAWVAEEVQDSEYRGRYVEALCQSGVPIRLIQEEFYGELMDGEEIYLYEIVKASVSRLGAFLKYLRLNVEKKDLFDMDAYEDWIQDMYANWPMNSEVTITGRMKKKNAGEISLTILAEIFSWHYSDTDILTVYTQDTDAYEFQKSAEEKLKKVFVDKLPVSVTYRSNDSILCQLYRDGQLTLEKVGELRKDARTVTYTVMREDKTIAVETRVLANEEFCGLVQDETVQIVF